MLQLLFINNKQMFGVRAKRCDAVSMLSHRAESVITGYCHHAYYSNHELQII